MDMVSARCWERRSWSSYEQSHWSDESGQVFGSEHIPEMPGNIFQLGATGQQITEFVKKA